MARRRLPAELERETHYLSESELDLLGRLAAERMPPPPPPPAEPSWTPHEGQRPPPGAWRVWTIMAGRGFGKTRAGSEWVSAMARRDGRMRIALVGATLDEVANVMVLGRSGLFAVALAHEELIWVPSKRTLTFHNGAQAFAYSGEKPDKLRGPSIIMPGATNWPNGPIRRRAGRT